MKQMVTDTQMNQVITYRNCKFIINEAYSSSNGLYVRALETKSWIKAGDSQWLSKRALKKAFQRVA